MIRLLFFLIMIPGFALSQGPYTLKGSQLNEKCGKGSAGVLVSGLKPGENLQINWSNGQSGQSISQLIAGEYSAHIVVSAPGDTVNRLDTTLVFTIEKEKCIVAISNHFTPNGDNYNDLWQIGNWSHYPRFELYVFNKWGQQVHSQKGEYVPWDGKWLGVNVPDGTYYYVFYYDSSDKSDLLKGDVTILR